MKLHLIEFYNNMEFNLLEGFDKIEGVVLISILVFIIFYNLKNIYIKFQKNA